MADTFNLGGYFLQVPQEEEGVLLLLLAQWTGSGSCMEAVVAALVVAIEIGGDYEQEWERG